MPGLFAQGLLSLMIDDCFLAILPACIQARADITAAVFAAQMHQCAARRVAQNRRHQMVGIAGHQCDIQPGVAGCLAGSGAHTIGSNSPTLARNSGHGMGRAQDDVPDGADRIPLGFDLHDRGLHNRQVGKPICTVLRKATGARFWSCQQKGWGHANTCKDCAKPPSVLPASAMTRNKSASLTFLGLESSCDDTAAAVVHHAPGETPQILANVVAGQTALHADFGGVVPEIAARAHAEKLDTCVEEALAEAGLALGDLDGIAVTAGPGLIGGVMSGVMCAKGLAAGAGLPLIGVNHLAGHALTPRLTDQLTYPYLMLLVSGGHCQFLLVRGAGDFTRLGGTIDDAPGEAFDKTARLLGLAQPGGPSVEAQAKSGDPKRFKFPRPLMNKPGCDMSFSGLKTAILRARDALVAEKGGITAQDRADICAGFQFAVRDVLVGKTERALATYLEESPETPALAVAGGVAANMTIRGGLETLCANHNARFLAPPLRLCTDNAAMIGWAGIEAYRNGQRDGMNLIARPRWPLDKAAAPMLGSGKKGAKA